MSFLDRHRTICDTLEQARRLAQETEQYEIAKLCEEALDYAKRMSAKLSEYKNGTVNGS